MLRHVGVCCVPGALSLVTSDDEVMMGGGCQVKAEEIISLDGRFCELSLTNVLAVVLEGRMHVMKFRG